MTKDTGCGTDKDRYVIYNFKYILIKNCIAMIEQSQTERSIRLWTVNSEPASIIFDNTIGSSAKYKISEEIKLHNQTEHWSPHIYRLFCPPVPNNHEHFVCHNKLDFTPH